jgi:hypothetical protein
MSHCVLNLKIITALVSSGRKGVNPRHVVRNFFLLARICDQMFTTAKRTPWYRGHLLAGNGYPSGQELSFLLQLELMSPSQQKQKFSSVRIYLIAIGLFLWGFHTEIWYALPVSGIYTTCPNHSLLLMQCP